MCAINQVIALGDGGEAARRKREELSGIVELARNQVSHGYRPRAQRKPNTTPYARLLMSPVYELNIL